MWAWLLTKGRRVPTVLRVVACILQGDRGGNASALPGVNATASTTSKVIQRSAALLYTLAGVQSSRTLAHESLLADAVREEQWLHADLAAIRGEDGAFYATKALLGFASASPNLTSSSRWQTTTPMCAFPPWSPTFSW